MKQFKKSGKSSKNTDKENSNIKHKAQINNRDSNTVTESGEQNYIDINSVDASRMLETDSAGSETETVCHDVTASKDKNLENLFVDKKTDSLINNTNRDLYPRNSLSQVSGTSQFEVEPNYRPTASTESLKQISRQINGILAESPIGFEVEQSQSEILELENRNRELAALLAQHVQTNEQLVSQNEQIRHHALSLQSQLDAERSENQNRHNKEIIPLKEQLQVHIQTIGILVAEKTEIQSHLVQSQKIADSRFGEIEDLTNRLKTSKQRVADLEQSVLSVNTSSQKLEQTCKESAKEIDKLKLELFKLNKAHDEIKQNSSEIHEKLKLKTSECASVQQTLEDLKRNFEMAELYNRQMSSQNESGQGTLKIVEQLQRERDVLSAQVQQSTESLQRATIEKDQLAEQYKLYIDQLQYQNTQLTTQVSSLTAEREKIVTQSHDLEATVLELQRKLEDISTRGPVFDEASRIELTNELMKLQSEQTDLSQRHESQIRDNAQLVRILEEKECKIIELETRLEDLSDMAGDKAELLENIQSDKTALSRALTQNRELKQQLAELQNGFVKMSNDNMELMTQLQTEQYGAREFQARLATQEDELKHFQELMAQKEIELKTAQQNSVEANKVKILHEQIQDRLRHYEAQAQLVETLQKELHSSQDMVAALTTQNSELRTMLIRATETRHLNADINVENAQRQDVIESLQTTIRDMEIERKQLIENLNQQIELTDHLGVRVSDMEEEIIQTNSANETDQVSRNEYNKIKYALDMIQDKYNRVMRDKADLSDKADELEHLVLQLQGETDTIGEYISLYHHQRALLQQRELQKNDYIKQLAKDREELQDKFGELQTLVMQLMGEKNMLHSYQRESVRPVSPNIHPPLPTKYIGDKQDDWPDYTSSESETESEVEAISVNDVSDEVGNIDPDAHDLPDEHGQVDYSSHANNQWSDDHNSDQTNAHCLHHHHNHHHHHEEPHTNRSRTHSKQEVTEEVTAHKILSLLSEIGQSNLVDSLSFMEKQFHPCKYCKGRLQIL